MLFPHELRALSLDLIVSNCADGSPSYCLPHINPASGSLFVQESHCERSALNTQTAIIRGLANQAFTSALFLSRLPFDLVMSCGMPVPPINGSILGQDFSLGARATYQCNPGFRLAGPITTSVICQESGRWSPIEAPPRCVREYFPSTIVTNIK